MWWVVTHTEAQDTAGQMWGKQSAAVSLKHVHADKSPPRLQAVDRHFKLPHASSKPVRSTSSMGDSTYKTLRFALRATLKTAIYRITTTFGDHLK